jgi:hypothetical protein
VYYGESYYDGGGGGSGGMWAPIPVGAGCTGATGFLGGSGGQMSTVGKNATGFGNGGGGTTQGQAGGNGSGGIVVVEW